MRSMPSLPCRGTDATFLSRVRATPEPAGVLHRRGWHLASGRSSANSTPALHSLTSSQKVTRVFSGIQEGWTAPTVKIRMPYRVNFGEVLRVVGSGDLLGNWAADRGLQLTWTEGDVWTVEVPFIAGHYEFKCVVYNVNTNSVTRWEDGGNRVLNIATEPGMWDVSCQWGATADMTQVFTPAPPPPPPPPLAEPEDSSVVSAALENAAPEGSGQELVQTFLVLEQAGEATRAERAAPAEADAAVASEGSSAPDRDAQTAASFSGRGGGAVVLLLATCAACAVATVALLAPGGLDTSSLGGGTGQSAGSALVQSTSLAGTQVRSQFQSQLETLGAQVSAVQPAVRAQMTSVTDGLAALQSRATAAAADAVAGTVELGSKAAAPQG